MAAALGGVALAREVARTTPQVLLDIAGVAFIPLGLALLRAASPSRTP